MLFDYKAVSLEGRMMRGQLDAGNLVDLEARLKRMDLDLVTGTPIHRRSRLFRNGVSRPELINFCFHLEQLARAGVPLLDGLADLRDSVDQARFREAIADLIESIEGGQTLSQAMSGHPETFTPVFSNLIRAGEASGQLPEVLGNLGRSLKWEDELASHTRRLMVYPAVVASVVLSAAGFLMIYMVPLLKVFVKNMGGTLPLHTRLLFQLSDLLAGYWHTLLLASIAVALSLQFALRTNPQARLRFDNLKLYFPVIGPILKKIILSRFAGTFAMLYAAGIPVLESIRTTRDIVGNRVVRKALEHVEQSIREGQNVAVAFRDAGIFPPLVVRMLRIGESTGGLDKALLNVAYFYNRDVKESVGKALALIEPLLTVVMGMLLGWIMLSVIGPIYDVISGIRM